MEDKKIRGTIKIDICEGAPNAVNVSGIIHKGEVSKLLRQMKRKVRSHSHRTSLERTRKMQKEKQKLAEAEAKAEISKSKENDSGNDRTRSSGVRKGSSKSTVNAKN